MAMHDLYNVAGHTTMATWLEQADKALYAAKSAGRNTIRIAAWNPKMRAVAE